MSRKKKIEQEAIENKELSAVSMFQLEDRVLFDGAAVADVVAAAQQAQAEIAEAQDADHSADHNADDNADGKSSTAHADDASQGSFSDYLEVAASGNIAVQTALEASTQIKVLFVADMEGADALAAGAGDYNVIISFDSDSTTSAQLLDALNSALEGGKADAIGFMVDPATEGAMEAFNSETGSAQFWDGVNDALNAQGSINLFGDADDTHAAEAISADYDRTVTVNNLDDSGKWNTVSTVDGGDFGDDLNDSVNLDDTLFEQDFLDSLDMLSDSPDDVRSVAFISRDINNLDTIIDGLGDDVDIVILDPSQDALQQITDYLNDTTDVHYSSLNFFAPGSTDALDFNGESISSQDLSDFSNEIVSWRNAMTDHASINIYGGDMTATESGRDFLDHLMAATGADIEVSDAFAGLDMAFVPDHDPTALSHSAEEVLDYAYNIERAPHTYYVVNGDDSGEGSLRWALEQANQDIGLDYIEFQLDDGTEISIDSGSLYITDSVIINSSGLNITVDGSALSDSLFVIDDGNASNQIQVEVHNLNIGGASAGGVDSVIGGAIQNHEALDLDGVIIQNSDAQQGGAIWNDVEAKINIELSDMISNHDLYFASEPHEVVFLSEAVANSPEIISSLYDKSNTDIVILHSGVDALQQITDYLNDADTQFDSIHILTHGSEGQLAINGQIIDAATVSENLSSISSWQTALKEGADIHFYGCDLASNEAGEQMLQMIAGATGADIAASTDTTGISGDWTLEYTIGNIHTAGLQFDINFDLLTYSSVASGDWNAAATWETGGTGTVTIIATDEVIINTGHTVTVNEDAMAGMVSVSGTLNVTGFSLNVGGGVSLGASGQLVIGAGGNVDIGGSITLSSGSQVNVSGLNAVLNAGGGDFAQGGALTVSSGGQATIDSGLTLGNGATMSATDGMLYIGGGVTLNAGSSLVVGINGELTVDGDMTVSSGDVVSGVDGSGKSIDVPIAGATINVTGGTLIVDGDMILEGAGSKEGPASGTTVSYGAGSITVSSARETVADVEENRIGKVEINGHLDASGDITLIGLAPIAPVVKTSTKAGVEAVAAAISEFTVGSYMVQRDGSISVNMGTFTVNGAFYSGADAQITISGGSSVNTFDPNDPDNYNTFGVEEAEGMFIVRGGSKMKGTLSDLMNWYSEYEDAGLGMLGSITVNSNGVLRLEGNYGYTIAEWNNFNPLVQALIENLVSNPLDYNSVDLNLITNNGTVVMANQTAGRAFDQRLSYNFDASGNFVIENAEVNFIYDLLVGSDATITTASGGVLSFADGTSRFLLNGTLHVEDGGRWSIPSQGGVWETSGKGTVHYDAPTAAQYVDVNYYNLTFGTAPERGTWAPSADYTWNFSGTSPVAGRLNILSMTVQVDNIVFQSGSSLALYYDATLKVSGEMQISSSQFVSSDSSGAYWVWRNVNAENLNPDNQEPAYYYTRNTSGLGGTVEYNGIGDQSIAGLNYFALVLSGSGNKIATGDITVAANNDPDGESGTTGTVTVPTNRYWSSRSLWGAWVPGVNENSIVLNGFVHNNKSFSYVGVDQKIAAANYGTLVVDVVISRENPDGEGGYYGERYISELAWRNEAAASTVEVLLSWGKNVNLGIYSSFAAIESNKFDAGIGAVAYYIDEIEALQYNTLWLYSTGINYLKGEVKVRQDFWSNATDFALSVVAPTGAEAILHFNGNAVQHLANRNYANMQKVIFSGSGDKIFDVQVGGVDVDDVNSLVANEIQVNSAVTVEMMRGTITVLDTFTDLDSDHILSGQKKFYSLDSNGQVQVALGTVAYTKVKYNPNDKFDGRSWLDSAQIVAGLQYNNLTVRNAEISKTLAADMAIYNTFNIDLAFAPGGPKVFDATGKTVTYNGTGDQIIANIKYGDLVLTGGGTKASLIRLEVVDTLTVDENITLSVVGTIAVGDKTNSELRTGSTVLYGADAAQEVIDLDYYNLVISGDGIKNYGIRGSVNPSLRIQEGGTLAINGPAQFVVNGSIGSSTNAVDVVMTDDSVLEMTATENYIGNFTPGDETTVMYTAAAGTQNVLGLNYHNLYLAGGVKALTGDMSINGAFQLAAGFVAGNYTNVNQYSVTYNGTDEQTIGGVVHNGVIYLANGTKRWNSAANDSAGTIVVFGEKDPDNAGYLRNGDVTLEIVDTFVVNDLAMQGRPAYNEDLPVGTDGWGTVRYIGSGQEIYQFSSPYWNLELAGSNSYIFYGTELVVTNNMTVNSGTLDLQSGNIGLNVGNDLSVNGGVLRTALAEIGGDLTLGATGKMVAGDETYIDGDFTIHLQDVSTAGDYTAGDNTYLKGNFVNNGDGSNFKHNNGTFTFVWNGADGDTNSDHYIDGNVTFNNLAVQYDGVETDKTLTLRSSTYNSGIIAIEGDALENNVTGSMDIYSTVRYVGSGQVIFGGYYGTLVIAGDGSIGENVISIMADRNISAGSLKIGHSAIGSEVVFLVEGENNSVFVFGATEIFGEGILRVQDGTVTLNYSLDMTSGFIENTGTGNGEIIYNGSSAIVGATASNFTAGQNTFSYMRTGNQVVEGQWEYYNLKLGGSGIKTVDIADFTINNLIMESSGSNLTALINGNMTAKTIDFSDAGQTLYRELLQLTGSLTVDNDGMDTASGTVEYVWGGSGREINSNVDYYHLVLSDGLAATGSYSTANGFTVYSDFILNSDFDYIDMGTDELTVMGNTQLNNATFKAAGSTINLNDIDLTNGILDFVDSVATGGVVRLSGDVTVTNLNNFNAGTSTFIYNGTDVDNLQTIVDFTYYNLEVSGADKTASDITVDNVFTVRDNTSVQIDGDVSADTLEFVTGTTTVANGQLYLTGSLSVSADGLTAGTSTIHFNGDSTQSIAGDLTYYNLEVSNGDKSLTGDVTVNGSFIFDESAGLVYLGDYDLLVDYLSDFGEMSGDDGRYFMINGTGRFGMSVPAGEYSNTFILGIETDSRWAEMHFYNADSASQNIFLSAEAYTPADTDNMSMLMAFTVSGSTGSFRLLLDDVSASAAQSGFSVSDAKIYYYDGSSWVDEGYQADAQTILENNGEYRFRSEMISGDIALVVTNTDSFGLGSLSYAVEYANRNEGLDKITFSTDFNWSGMVIQILSGLTVTDDLVIEGPGSENIVLDGSNLDASTRILTVSAGVGLEISGITLANGIGGAIMNSGSLVMSDVNIYNNGSTYINGGGIFNATGASIYGNRIQLTNNTAIDGAAIYNQAGSETQITTTTGGTTTTTTVTVNGGYAKFENLTVEGNTGISSIVYSDEQSSLLIMNGTVSNNQTDTTGAAILNGGDFYGYNLTVVGNNGFGFGQMLDVQNSIVLGQTTLENTTIAYNGQDSFYFDGSESVIGVKSYLENLMNTHLSNTIWTKAPTSGNQQVYLDYTLSGYSLSTVFGSESVTGVDYGDHGGWVNTLALKQSISSSTDGVTKFDARGYMVNGSRDYGAYEYNAYVAFNQTQPQENQNFYTSIQDAIDAARAGEVIELMDTRIKLDGEIFIDKDITIVGHGEGDTVLAGANGQRIFTINDNDVSTQILVGLQGMTLQGYGNPVSGNGGLVLNSENLVLNQVSLAKGYATNGGALYNNGGNVVMVRTTFTDNYASNNGGAVYNAGGGMLNMSETTLSNNRAGNSGGGLYSASNGIVTINNSTVDYNYAASGNGGGIYLDFNTFTAGNLTVAYNITNGLGSGIYGSGDWVLTNVTVARNYSYNDAGAGVYFKSGVFSMSNGLFVYNSAQGLSYNLYIDASVPESNVLIYNSLLSEYSIADNYRIGDDTTFVLLRDNIFDGGLRDNGGWVRTLALSSYFAASEFNRGTTTGSAETDARGYLINGTRDLGAYEYHGYLGTLTYRTESATSDTVTGIYDLNQLSNSYDSISVVISSITSGGATNYYFSESISTNSGELTGNIVTGDATLELVSSRILTHDTNFAMWTRSSASGVPYKVQNINVYGHVEGGTVISGGKLGSLFTVSSTKYSTSSSTVGVFGTLTFDRITFSDGISWNGPVMSYLITGQSTKEASGSVIFNDSQIQDNVAFGDGGAIYLEVRANTLAAFTVQINTSTLAGNLALGDGGAVYAAQAVTISTSTLAYNTALGNGGAIAIVEGAGDTKGSGTISNSTISFNTANEGGGIYNDNTLTMNATILAKNRSTEVASSGSANYIGYDYYATSRDGVTATGSNNIIEHQNGYRFAQDSDNNKNFFAQYVSGKSSTLVTANYLYNINYYSLNLYQTGLVADNGGWSETIELSRQSFAKGQLAASGTDQRGYGANEGRDIGAFESGGTFASVVVSGETVYFNSLQAAINAAGSNGTVTVSAVRIKAHDINITQNVTVKATAEAGSARVRGNQLFIDAGFMGRVFSNASGKTFNLSDAYLYNGVSMAASDSSGMFSGGNGGLIYNNGMMVLTNVSGTNSFAQTSGGAIYSTGSLTIVANGDRSLIDTTFENNRAGFNGGAIYAVGQLTLQGLASRQAPDSGQALYFRYNRAAYGGAIYLEGASLDADDVYMIGNSASRDGGALYVKAAASDSVSFNKSTLTYNGANNDGGALYQSGGTLTVWDSFWNYNTAFVSGGAIYGDSILSVTLVTKTTSEQDLKRYTRFLNNHAMSGNGGAIAMINPGEIEIYAEKIQETIDFDSNYAYQGDGGAIYVYGDEQRTTISIHDQGDFSDNHAVNGGALYFENVLRADIRTNTDFYDNDTSRPSWEESAEPGSGGAIYILNAGGFYINAVYDDPNEAIPGNVAIYRNDAGISGGGIYLEDVGVVSLRDLQLGNNTTRNNEGGGIYIVGNTTEITLVDVDAYNNYTGYDASILQIVDSTIVGGALYVNAAGAVISISNSGFDANSAGEGASVYVLNALSMEIISSTFGNNYGGALYVGTLTDTLNLNFVTFGYNNARSYSNSDALYYGSGTLKVANSIFYETAGDAPVILESGVDVIGSNNNIFYRSNEYALNNSGALFGTPITEIEAYRWNEASGESAVVRDASGNIVGNDTATNFFIADNLYLCNDMAYNGNSLSRSLALESRDSIAIHYIMNGQETAAGSADATVWYDQRGNLRTGISVVETLYYFDGTTMWVVTRNSQQLGYASQVEYTGSGTITGLNGVVYKEDSDGGWYVEFDGVYGGHLSNAQELASVAVGIHYEFYRPSTEYSSGWEKVTVTEDGTVSSVEAPLSELNKIGGITVGIGAFEPNFYMVITTNVDDHKNPDWFINPEGSTWHNLDAALTGSYGDPAGITLREAIYWIDNYSIIASDRVDADGNFLYSSDNTNSSGRFIIDADRYVKFSDNVVYGGMNEFVLTDGETGNIEINNKDVAIGMISGYQGWSEFVSDNTFQSQDSSTRITINGSDKTRIFKVTYRFDFNRDYDDRHEWQSTLTLNNITLTNGFRDASSNTNDLALGLGGAIYNEGILIMNNVLIKDSVASNASSNPSLSSYAGLGGAIYNSYSGEVYMYDSTLENNRAVATDHSTKTTNAGRGGAIYSDGTLEIYRSAIIGNTAEGFGLSSTDSRASTTGLGGGLYIASGSVTMVASTVTLNQTVMNGTGTGSLRSGLDGAAIRVDGGYIVFDGNTIAYNKVSTFNSDTTSGYAVVINSGAWYVSMTNNIIAENRTKSSSPQRKDLYYSVNIYGGNNIIGWQDTSGSAQFIFGGYDRNIVGDIGTGLVDKLYLAAETDLKYNGGMTRNYRIGAGSVAIDAAQYADGSFDQRNLTAGYKQDRSTIGAYELLTYVEAESSQTDKALTDTGITYDYGFYLDENGVVQQGRSGWNHNLRNALYLADEGAEVLIKIIEGSETFNLAEGAGALQIFNSITVTASGVDSEGNLLRLTVDAGNGLGEGEASQAFVIDDSDADVPSASVISATLEGFNIQNTASAGDGGAILAIGNLTLNDINITNSQAVGNGGAIFTSGKLTLGNVNIENASSGANGGAIYINAGELSATGLNIQNATAANGGGIYLNNSVGVVIVNSIINNAVATTGNGGALFIAGGQATVSGTVLSNSTAAVDGGGIYFKGNSLTLDGVAIGNTGEATIVNAARGGGIFMSSGNLNMLNTTIANNNADISGGGIYFASINGTITMNFSTLANNTAGDANGGGGMYFENYTNLNVTNSILAGNTSAGEHDDIYAAGNYSLSSFTYNVLGVSNLTGISTTTNVVLGSEGDYSWLDSAMTEVEVDNADGRTTWVILMSEDSPAKGLARYPGEVVYDQAGQGRPRQNATAGAYEMNPEPVYTDVYKFVGTSDPVDNSILDFSQWEWYDSVNNVWITVTDPDFNFGGEGKIFIFDTDYVINENWVVAENNKVVLSWNSMTTSDVSVTINNENVSAKFEVNDQSTLELAVIATGTSLLSISESSTVKYTATASGQQVLSAKNGTKYGNLVLSGGDKTRSIRLEVAGDLTMSADLAVASGDLVVGGGLTGGGSIDVQDGAITAIGLDTDTELGSVSASGNIRLIGADTAITINGGITSSGGSVELNAGTGTNAGINVSGGISAAGDITVTVVDTASGIDIEGSVISSTGSVSVNAGTGDVSLSGGSIYGAVGSTSVAGGNLNLNNYVVGSATSTADLGVPSTGTITASGINTIYDLLGEGISSTGARMVIADMDSSLAYNVGDMNSSLGMDDNSMFNLKAITNNGGTFQVITTGTGNIDMNELNGQELNTAGFHGALIVSGYDVEVVGENDFSNSDIALQIDNRNWFKLGKKFTVSQDLSINNVMLTGNEAELESDEGSVIINGEVSGEGYDFRITAADLAEFNTISNVNNLTVSSNEIIMGSGTLNVLGSAEFISGVTMDIGGGITAGGDVTFTKGVNVTGNSAITAGGNIDFGTGGSITGEAGAGLTLTSGNLIEAASIDMPGNLTVNGSLNVTQNIDNVGNLTINNGLVSVSGSADVSGALNLNGTGDSTVGGDLGVGGNMNILAGNTLSAANMNLGGSMNLAQGSSVTTGTLTLSGTATQTLNMYGTSNISALVLDNTSSAMAAILNGDLTVDTFTFSDHNAQQFMINNNSTLMVADGIENAGWNNYFVMGSKAMLQQVAGSAVDPLEFWVGSTTGVSMIALSNGIVAGQAYGVGFENSITNDGDPITGSLEDTVKATWSISGGSGFDVSVAWNGGLNGNTFNYENAVYNLWISGAWEQGTTALDIQLNSGIYSTTIAGLGASTFSITNLGVDMSDPYGPAPINSSRWQDEERNFGPFIINVPPSVGEASWIAMQKYLQSRMLTNPLGITSSPEQTSLESDPRRARRITVFGTPDGAYGLMGNEFANEVHYIEEEKVFEEDVLEKLLQEYVDEGEVPQQVFVKHPGTMNDIDRAIEELLS